MARLLESYQPAQLKSHPVVRTDLQHNSSSGSGGAPVPSIASFFSDAARVRVLQLPAPAPAAEAGGGGRRRPWGKREEQQAERRWAAAVDMRQSRSTNEEEEEEEEEEDREEQQGGTRRSTPPWLWVAVGLVGVGLTMGMLGGGNAEEEDFDEKEGKKSR